jgi:hypothetical protein
VRQILTAAWQFISFLAGFWRQNYRKAITAITQLTLVAVSDKASSISKASKRDTPNQRAS